MRHVASTGPLHFHGDVFGAYRDGGTYVFFFCDIFLTSKGWGKDLAAVSFVSCRPLCV